MSVFLTAFGIGLAVVATPGPVTAQAIRSGLAKGFRAALFVQIGALLGVVVWGGVGLLGVALIAENALLRDALSILGIALLLWLMGKAINDAFRYTQIDATPLTQSSNLATGAALSLLNPLPAAFWLGVGSSLVLSPNLLGITLFFGGLLSSALLWSLLLAGLTAWGQRFVTPRLFQLVNLACAIVFAAFAIKIATATLLR